MTSFLEPQDLWVVNRNMLDDIERSAVERGERAATDLAVSDWSGRMQTLSIAHVDEVQAMVKDLLTKWMLL